MLHSATQAWICQATAAYVAAVLLVSHRKINVVSVLALFQKIIIIVKRFFFSCYSKRASLTERQC